MEREIKKESDLVRSKDMNAQDIPPPVADGERKESVRTVHQRRANRQASPRPPIHPQPPSRPAHHPHTRRGPSRASPYNRMSPSHARGTLLNSARAYLPPPEYCSSSSYNRTSICQKNRRGRHSHRPRRPPLKVKEKHEKVGTTQRGTRGDIEGRSEPAADASIDHTTDSPPPAAARNERRKRPKGRNRAVRQREVQNTQDETSSRIRQSATTAHCGERPPPAARCEMVGECTSVPPRTRKTGRGAMSMVARRGRIAIPSSNVRLRGSREVSIDPHAFKQARPAGDARVAEKPSTRLLRMGTPRSTSTQALGLGNMYTGAEAGKGKRRACARGARIEKMTPPRCMVLTRLWAGRQLGLGHSARVAMLSRAPGAPHKEGSGQCASNENEEAEVYETRERRDGRTINHALHCGALVPRVKRCQRKKGDIGAETKTKPLKLDRSLEKRPGNTSKRKDGVAVLGRNRLHGGPLDFAVPNIFPLSGPPSTKLIPLLAAFLSLSFSACLDCEATQNILHYQFQIFVFVFDSQRSS
ncbi:hypothetical protein B0H10DRAFT_2199447 [Mycena sp. CBHHK59/15]|nr:hypothetical protein B0H10DRAFT_2199447 [Mycena sp. CBHHK59/15]